MIRLLIRAGLASFVAVAAALALLVAFGRHVQYEQSIQSFFPDDDPAVIDYIKTSEVFGNDNLVFIAYDDPALFSPGGMDRVAELAQSVGPGAIPAVVEVQSLVAMPRLWEIDDRLIALEKLPALFQKAARAAARELVKNLDATGEGLSIGAAVRGGGPEEREAIKEKVTAHPLFRGTVVDAGGTSTAVVVRLAGMAEQDPKATVAALRERADAFARRHRLGRPALVGPPVILADGFTHIEIDGRRLAMAGMALIGLVTLTATQSLWWAIVPILCGWTVWLAAETLLAAFDLRLSLSGGPLVAQIIVLTMPAASHLAIHYRDDRRHEADPRTAARSTLAAVSVPILWCALTGTIGYGALVTSNVVPIRQFGAILAVCTLLAAVLTLAISPVAMVPPFRLEVPVRPGSTSRVSDFMSRLTAAVLRHPGPIVLGVFAVVLPVTLGMRRLEYESNYINAFKPETRIVQDYRAVESRLGGIGLASLVVPVGEALDMAALAKFRDLDGRIAALRRRDGRPAIDHAISLATVLDPDGRLAALPPAQAADALATKLDLIALSPQARLLHSFWAPEAGRARVLIRLREAQPAQAKEAAFVAARRLAHGRFGPDAYLTGLSYLLTQTTRGVMSAQWTTFAWATAGILLMLTLAFRGPVLAVLAILPTLLAVGLVLGLMGWLGVKLDIATALVASVALGLSVDDTFHCLLQYRRHRGERPFREALMASYAVTGPGVILSSLAVAIGFAVLMLSEFVPFANFGAMVGIATLGSSLGNLMLLPACLALGDRWSRHRQPSGQPEATPAGAQA